MARGKKVYTAHQHGLLAEARRRASVEKTSEVTVRDKYLAAIERELASIRMETSLSFHAAIAGGVQKSDLLEAYGVKNWNTLQRVLDFAADRVEIEGAIEAEVEAAQPFEVLETLAWNDIPHVRKLLAGGADGAAAVGAARLVVSRTDESVKGWVISVVSYTGRKFGFVEDKDGPGNWWEGRGAYRLRENSDADTSWDELAERQTGQVRELVLWVAENITDWGE